MATTLARTFTFTGPLDLRRTMLPLQRGMGDPTMLVGDREVWRATRTSGGPATLHLTLEADRLVAEAWGPGADETLESASGWAGLQDDDRGFRPRHRVVKDLHRRLRGVRLTRTGRPTEALIPAVLEQKVTGREARDAFRRLVLKYGAPAPGPAPEGMCVPPSAEAWRHVPSWDWHRAGVDPKRSRTICLAMRCASRLEQAVGMAPDDAARRLSAVPGIGVWTVAEIAQRALGDSDALSVGDYHLSNVVGSTLLGHRIDDDEMLELLEPLRPHRFRAVRLLEVSGLARNPRFGARMAIPNLRAL